MQHRATGTTALLSGLLIALAGCDSSDGAQPPRVSDAAACADLQAAAFGDNTTVTRATYVTSDLTIGATTAAAPFCRIEAVARPTGDSQIGFEVWLPPLATWNTKYQSIGSGSSAGSINSSAMASPLADGYAVMATDNGHVTDATRPNGAAEQTWALGHPEKIIDFAYRAQHVSTVRAKEVASAFYRQVPTRAYFVGCSQGGRRSTPGSAPGGRRRSRPPWRAPSRRAARGRRSR